MVHTFLTKFSRLLVAKLVIAFRRIMQVKLGTDLLCHSVKYGESQNVHSGRRRESLVFFNCMFVFKV